MGLDKITAKKYMSNLSPAHIQARTVLFSNGSAAPTSAGISRVEKVYRKAVICCVTILKYAHPERCCEKPGFEEVFNMLSKWNAREGNLRVERSWMARDMRGRTETTQIVDVMGCAKPARKTEAAFCAAFSQMQPRSFKIEETTLI
ncbi:hypothetical protein B0H17DRAFT_1138645 [Mycena rosella]|uniref:Uncharacterized protein n=1 Tax=Mycena rosella TaxID=1033263 RepID=A0AAD7D605_MYCRO|nr:hypothetical protein B0H17DRAFT_1138645 [Mycena rosella]